MIYWIGAEECGESGEGEGRFVIELGTAIRAGF